MTTIEKIKFLSAMITIIIGMFTIQTITWVGITFIILGLFIFYKIFKTPIK